MKQDGYCHIWKRPAQAVACLAGLALIIASGCKSGEGMSRAGQDRTSMGPKVVKEDGNETTSKYTEALDARDRGDYDEALKLFRELLARNPTMTSAYMGIGDVYMEQQDYTKAEPVYARAAALEPRSFDAQYKHGVVLQVLGRFIEAIKAYHRALAIDPQDSMANLAMATTYLQIGEPENARTFAEKAVQADPENGAAHVNLGTIYERDGRHAEAIREYEAAIELMEPSPQLVMNLISVLSKEKRYQEVVNTAENLLRIEKSSKAYERLGWGYFNLNMFEKSIDAYRTSVELDPSNWPALNGIGVNALNAWLQSERTDWDAKGEARRAFQRSLQINKDQMRVLELMTRYLSS